MKTPFLSFSSLLFSLFAGHADAALVMTAVQDYDSTNNSNTIDRYATGNAGTYGTFASNVASAFTAGRGGVINFDTGLTGSQSGITTTYAGGSKTLNIGTNVDVNAQTSANITGISGTNLNTNSSPTGGFLFQSTSTAGQQTILTFDSITNGSPGEYVSEIGFTILSRINGGGSPTITATVLFSDNTTASASASFTQTATGEDTFFSFAATGGRSITSLTIDYGGTGDLRRGIDDLAFITVPEPTSALMAGMFGVLGLMRRRRVG